MSAILCRALNWHLFYMECRTWTMHRIIDLIRAHMEVWKLKCKYAFKSLKCLQFSEITVKLFFQRNVCAGIVLYKVKYAPNYYAKRFCDDDSIDTYNRLIIGNSLRNVNKHKCIFSRFMHVIRYEQELITMNWLAK